jgi:hypothetical protein
MQSKRKTDKDVSALLPGFLSTTQRPLPPSPYENGPATISKPAAKKETYENFM